MKIKSGLIVAMAAGSVAGLAQANDGLDRQLKSYEVAPAIRGHVYINQKTGERVVTTGIRPSVNNRGVGWTWDLTYPDPCDPNTDTEAQGYWYTPLHDAALGDAVPADPGATAAWGEWIEHPGNTIITGFSFLYATAVLDPEEDGTAGHELFLCFTESDRAPAAERSGAVAHSPVVITDLFGSADGSVAGWAVFVELTESVELGDTDGSVPGQPAGTDSAAATDPDSLIDSGFMFTYNQPGVGEGDLLGNRFPELAGVFAFDALDVSTFPNIADIGPFLGHPSGDAGVGGEPNCYLDPADPNSNDWPHIPGCGDAAGAPFGTWDAFALVDALGTDLGAFFFGGFACTDNGPGLPFNTPWAGSAFAFNIDLVGGPSGCNAADIAEPFGVLDLADIGAFVTGFLAMDPISDLAPPAGVFDLADLSAFVTAFLAGCPTP